MVYLDLISCLLLSQMLQLDKVQYHSTVQNLASLALSQGDSVAAAATLIFSCAVHLSIVLHCTAGTVIKPCRLTSPAANPGFSRKAPITHPGLTTPPWSSSSRQRQMLRRSCRFGRCGRSSSRTGNRGLLPILMSPYVMGSHRSATPPHHPGCTLCSYGLMGLEPTA